jgi:FAD/FMN-containing dehydrogenase
MDEWSNWSGSLKFTPSEFVTTNSENEICEKIWRLRSEGKKLKVVGAGHSSSPLVETDNTLIRLDKFKGIVRHNKSEETVTLRTGMTIKEVNDELQQIGLALFNTGDVDVQMLAGAIATGTHGTGKELQNLSSMLQGVRMVTSMGNIKEFSQSKDPAIMSALRVSLGSLGIFTEITIKVVPLFKLRRIEICTQIENCLQHFDELAKENRNVDFYWYPRNDEAKIRILNEPDKSPVSFPFKYYCKEDHENWIGQILPKNRQLKFDEIEYAFSEQAAMECFRKVRSRIKTKHRKDVAWRVLYRTIAKDENYLSPHYKRDSVSISIHHNAGLPFQEYFSDIETIFNEYGGRPHWGKKHTLKAEQLEKLYPEWKVFHKVRKSLDPDEVFINNYLRDLFG